MPRSRQRAKRGSRQPETPLGRGCGRHPSQQSTYRGPALDRNGDWRIRMRRSVAGRGVQVVVAVREHGFSVITVT
jgi:hypothetical protein